jgi:hypothetical protein
VHAPNPSTNSDKTWPDIQLRSGSRRVCDSTDHIHRLTMPGYPVPTRDLSNQAILYADLISLHACKAHYANNAQRATRKQAHSCNKPQTQTDPPSSQHTAASCLCFNLEPHVPYTWVTHHTISSLDFRERGKFSEDLIRRTSSRGTDWTPPASPHSHHINPSTCTRQTRSYAKCQHAPCIHQNN